MMTAALMLAAAILGWIIGVSMNSGNEDCPRRVLDYNCRGSECDHRKSLLYENMASMARNEEEKNGNYRGGI